MLLRYLLNQFIQNQARSAFASATQGKPAAIAAKAVPRASPQSVDGVLFYPSELDGGGTLDLTKEKTLTYCEAFTEQLGIFAGRQVALIEVGEGSQARSRAEAALKFIEPLWVISFGFASGLTPEVRPGQIVMTSRIRNEQGEARRAGLSLAAGQKPPPGMHWGDLLTVAKLPETSEARTRHAQGGAIAWDMDSYFIATAIPDSLTLISVRIISEAIDNQLPKAVKFIKEQKSLAGKLGAATGALLDQPASLQKMWKLRDDAIKLSDRLAKFLTGVVEQLPKRGSKSDGAAT